MSEQNKATMRRIYDEVVNTRNFDLIDEIMAENFVEHEAFPGLANDRSGVRAFFEMMTSAFPDLRIDAQDVIAEGDKVAARIVMSGTHKGDFMGAAPTGKEFTIQGIDIVHFAGGKAVAHWGVTDQVAMAEQLGIAPSA